MRNIIHIKNPLTIIALFAGLSETLLTTMLPKMPSEVQSSISYFVIAFPFYLVTCFFFILWDRHHVLYAPSDFRTDDAFSRTLKHRSPSEKVRQDRAEWMDLSDNSSEAEGSEADAHAEGDDSSPPASDASDEPIRPQEDVNSPEKRPSEALRKKPQAAYANSRAALNYLSESIAIDLLSKEMGVTFERNVSFGLGGRILDAVHLGAQKNYLVEIKYAGTNPYSRLVELAHTLHKSREAFPEEIQKNLEEIGVIVFDDDDLALKFSNRLQRNFQGEISSGRLSRSARLRIASMNNLKDPRFID